MSKKRVKIPKKIENEVMLKSKGKCYCGKRGDEIHHIDKNNSNNNFDNLVLICHDHHDDASVTTVLKKRLSPAQIKHRRDELYRQNEIKGKLELKHYSNTLKKITDENLFRAALDASIVIEIIKIRAEFSDENDWEKRAEIICKLRKYSYRASIRVSHEVMEFFSEVSGYTRGGMPSSVADLILYTIIDFFPYSDDPKDKKLILEIADVCGNIAFGISYDAFIHLGNLAVAISGLNILKYIFTRETGRKLVAMSKIAIKQHSELERTLQRPERDDLENAKRLLKVYKDDMHKPGLNIPDDIPADLYSLMQEHEEASYQKKQKQ